MGEMYVPHVVLRRLDIGKLDGKAIICKGSYTPSHGRVASRISYNEVRIIVLVKYVLKDFTCLFHISVYCARAGGFESLVFPMLHIFEDSSSDKLRPHTSSSHRAPNQKHRIFPSIVGASARPVLPLQKNLVLSLAVSEFRAGLIAKRQVFTKRLLVS
jgi:hypothetical protein